MIFLIKDLKKLNLLSHKMERFTEFLSRFPEGRYDLFTLESVDKDNFPYLEIIGDILDLRINRCEVFLRINGQDCDNNDLCAHLSYKNTANEILALGSKHFPIEEDIENYLKNSEKSFHEILKDLAIAIRPIIDCLMNTRLKVNIPKSPMKA